MEFNKIYAGCIIRIALEITVLSILLLAGGAGAITNDGVVKLIDIEVDYDPSYSPDGSKIIFSAVNQTNSGSIQILNLSSKEIRKINMPNSESRYFLFTEWSPIGDRIAYASYYNYENIGDICTINMDGSNENCLTPDQDFSVGGPSYSPDGNKIAYYTHIHPEDRGDVWIVDVGSMNKTALTNSTEDNKFRSEPSFSPDGSKIVYACCAWPYSNIWIMNADGANNVQITSGSVLERYPSWSPDGNYIAYQKSECPNYCPWNIWVMKADGSEQTQLTNWTTNGIDGGQPNWHPNENKIVFVSNGFSGNNWDIYEMTLGGINLSNSGNGTWQYSRDLAIKNPGNVLTDYQVLVNLTGISFPIEANTSGADIRFTDANGSELSYWIENWDFTNSSGQVWVNVTNVPSGISSLRMWYGNPNATISSNGDKTFEFFDDFSNGLSKWDNFGGTGVILESGRLKIFYGNINQPYVKTLRTFNRGIIIEVDTESTNVSGIGTFPNIVGYGLNYGNCVSSSGAFVTAWYGSDKWGIWDQCINETGRNLISAGFNTNKIYKYKFYIKQNEYYADIDDGTISLTRPGTDTNKEVTLGIEAHGYNYATTYFDDVRVRKYTSPEPYIAGYINGTVQNNSTGIAEAIVTANINISTKTNASGFYSMLLPLGEYHITAVSEPRFYVNNSIIANAVAGSTTLQDIELLKKSTGNITGSVSTE